MAVLMESLAVILKQGEPYLESSKQTNYGCLDGISSCNLEAGRTIEL